jgi:hypothetical protein
MSQSSQNQHTGDPRAQYHESNLEIHHVLVQLVKEKYQANDYKLEIAGGQKSPKDFYGKALLQTGSGDSRKAYFKVDGRQRIPTIVVLNGQQLAKREIAIGQKYRVYIPGGQQVATLREEK